MQLFVIGLNILEPRQPQGDQLFVVTAMFCHFTAPIFAIFRKENHIHIFLIFRNNIIPQNNWQIQLCKNDLSLLQILSLMHTRSLRIERYAYDLNKVGRPDMSFLIKYLHGFSIETAGPFFIKLLTKKDRKVVQMVYVGWTRWETI